MKITLAMIIEKMNRYSIQYSNRHLDSGAPINGAKILKSPVKAYQEDIIYIMQGSCVPADSSGYYPSQLMLVLKPDENKENTSETRQMLAVYTEEDPYNILEEILDILVYYRKLFDNLLTASQQGQGLTKMLDIISIHYGNPVVVYDRSMKLLAYSGIFSMDDDTWYETMQKGYVEFPGSLNNEIKKYLQMVTLDNSAFSFTHSMPKLRFISKNILVSGRIVAMLHVLEKNHNLTKGSLDLMGEISTILSIEIEKNDLMHYRKGLLYEQFIVDLLEKKITNMQALNARAKNLGWHLSGQVSCIVIASDADDYLTDEQLSRLLVKLMTILPVRGVVYKNGIVLIINSNCSTLFQNTAGNVLLELLGNKKLCAGSSRCSNSLIDIPELYSQALQAVKLGKYIDSSKVLYSYSDCSLFAFFDDCIQQGEIKKYFFPSLYLLNEYDEKNHTDLANTLRLYVLNRNNQAKTASELFIHRTTLIYRIHKIKEIMDIDLDDPDTNFHIQLSFRLSEFYESLLQRI